jgi:hypothetical protein
MRARKGSRRESKCRLRRSSGGENMETATLLSQSAQASGSTVIEGNIPPHGEDHRILLDQVERILHSEELRGSEVLRRLLRFLAEKSASGEADELKEYIVAIECLGKPASYDPRQNSAVRIQVGRLRQKLSDYYRAEGVDDPVIVDIPKGHFKLKYEFRDSFAPIVPGPLVAEIPPHETLAQKLGMMRIPVTYAACALFVLGIVASYYALRPAPSKATSSAYRAAWNPDVEALWRPFIATSRPMIVAIEDPLFVEMNLGKGIYFRDKTLNTWSDVKSSPTMESLRQALKNPDAEPTRYYTTFGEVNAAFLLARLLGSRVQNLSLMKTTDLSVQELADNNVVFVGVENRFFQEQMQAAPIKPPLQPVQGGVQDLRPGPNEPAVFHDQYSDAPTGAGVVYALVTHFPGPLGENDVESFTSSRAAGYVAAVKAFTEPSFVQTVVTDLKRSCGGKMPRYYQVLLKVKFTEEVPTEITYVLAQRLPYPGKP